MQDYLPFTRPTLDAETIQGVVDVLNSGWITSGPQVEQFEQALAGYLGGERWVRVLNSGTSALEQALVLGGIGPGDEVIVPAMTFVATANVVVRVGARPVLVDVELTSRNLDLNQAEAAITPRTRAIMPVHFAGLPVAMDELYALAERHQLRVIEDAAHAIGSQWRNRRIGSFGDIVCFSFHANKNLTTIEGGAISVGAAELAWRLEILRFHGISRLPDGGMDVTVASGKFNLPDVSARIGLGQLRRLDEFNRQRRLLAHRYFDRLADEAPDTLPARGDAGHSWHMFTFLLPLAKLRLDRTAFRQRLHERGIGVGVHYPALPSFSFYQQLGYRESDFPNAARIGRETVTLPLFPAMAIAEVDRVCDAMQDVLRGCR